MKHIALSALIAGVALVAPASAATIKTLDDFTDYQAVADHPDLPAVPTTSTLTISTDFGMIDRTLTATNIFDGAQAKYETSLVSDSGTLAMSNTKFSTGIVSVSYANLGDIDLGPNAKFVFNIDDFDGGVVFSAFVKDGLGNTSTYSEALPVGFAFSTDLLFSAFTGSADFNDVVELTFSIDSGVTGVGAVDGALNSIQISAVPVPAAGFLLIGAVGGLAALRRKKSA